MLTWRDVIRMNNQVPVPGEAITGLATTPLPRPVEVIEKLGLWKRVPQRNRTEPCGERAGPADIAPRGHGAPR